MCKAAWNVQIKNKIKVIIERKPQYKSGKDIKLPVLIDLLISNNFSSMTFYGATSSYFTSYRSSKYTTVHRFFTDFLA